MKIGNKMYENYEMDLIAAYEEIYKIPADKRITQWWGDVAIYEFVPGTKESDAEARLAEALKAVKMTRDELKNYSYTYRQTLEIKLKENMPKKYEAVIIFNKPMLFTNERLEYDNVPDGLYRYDIRDGGMDGNMCELKDQVAVNHWGTVLSKDAVESRMVDGKEMNTQEGIQISEDDYNYTGEVFTTQEYLDNYEYLLKEYCEPEQDKGIVMQ